MNDSSVKIVDSLSHTQWTVSSEPSSSRKPNSLRESSSLPRATLPVLRTIRTLKTWKKALDGIGLRYLRGSVSPGRADRRLTLNCQTVYRIRRAPNTKLLAGGLIYPPTNQWPSTSMLFLSLMSLLAVATTQFFPELIQPIAAPAFFQSWRGQCGLDIGNRCGQD